MIAIKSADDLKDGAAYFICKGSGSYEAFFAEGKNYAYFENFWRHIEAKNRYELFDRAKREGITIYKSDLGG